MWETCAYHTPSNRDLRVHLLYKVGVKVTFKKGNPPLPLSVSMRTVIVIEQAMYVSSQTCQHCSCFSNSLDIPDGPIIAINSFGLKYADIPLRILFSLVPLCWFIVIWNVK